MTDITAKLAEALEDILREAVILSDDYLKAFEHWPKDDAIQGWEKARWLRASAAAKNARAQLAAYRQHTEAAPSTSPTAAAVAGEPVALDVTLTEEEASFLRDTLASEDDDPPPPIRLMVGPGHSGYGIYVSLAEYPDEGSSLLTALTAPHPSPSAAEQAGRWQPIETAPKDGRLILVHFGGKGVRAVAWEAPAWSRGDDSLRLWCVDDDKHGPYALRGYLDGHSSGPTHWMPLPAVPSASPAEAPAEQPTAALRERFDAWLKTTPDWAPEYEQHRAWVELFAWLAVHALAAHPQPVAPAGQVATRIWGAIQLQTEAKRDEVPLPPLPKVGPICYASASDILLYKPAPEVGTHLPGVRDVALWSTDQLREYGRQCAQAAVPVMQWLPIETAPQDGYMLVHEDGAIRALLRIDGVWHKPGYPALITPEWGDVLVGDDAKRVLPAGYRLELRDGCCDNPTHWMPMPKSPNLIKE